MTAPRLKFAALALACLWSALAGAQAPPETADPNAGFIHATVTWPNGESKTGFLRWGDEEAFWDDLFHCGYRDLVWAEHADLERLRKERRIAYYKSHGLAERLAYALHEDKQDPVGWRMFLSRFGDLRSIEIHDGEDDFAVTADGARHQIGGFANDAGARLHLYVAGEEPERIRWNDLSEIVFSQAPTGAVPYAGRLYGVVETSEGAFEGFVQWDMAECTTADMLNGKLVEDGKRNRHDDADLALPMGEIRTIARARDGSAEVVMLDGTRHNLRGTDDVGSGNNGIMVEVAGLGRVTVPWRRFESVTFQAGHGSGPGRNVYRNAGPLQGDLTDSDGVVHRGRLVFDLDEAWLWDIFNGTDAAGLEYNIPFHQLARIETAKDQICRVILRSGLALELGENQDTGDDHAGVLVFASSGAAAEHLAWRQVQSITFSHQADEIRSKKPKKLK